jgi:hypothetical protein
MVSGVLPAHPEDLILEKLFWQLQAQKIFYFMHVTVSCMKPSHSQPTEK